MRSKIKGDGPTDPASGASDEGGAWRCLWHSKSDGLLCGRTGSVAPD
ncbi:hypothetical protein APY04_1052 [Hyphomicrobium sulfonivorans]|uniref:Uncharacterized protein n=1 Tax=Hyphomicrobium sulfonivorans TaxID=121290 RepID=A0A120CX51_HYPSL|nr:hypothetical protein APY04_1052 [Hyphomicrobium sulfonivorans]